MTRAGCCGMAIHRSGESPSEKTQQKETFLWSQEFASRIVLILALMAGAPTWAGCGSGGGGGVQANKAIPATNSSVIAIDCKRQRAYVPLAFLNDSLHGQVAVLDLSVDPDLGDPLVAVIDIGLIALPRASAVDIDSGIVLVLADEGSATGSMLLIDEDTFKMTVVPFPAGSRPNGVSGVVVNEKDKTALVSMVDAPDCGNGLGGCTGQALFDLDTNTFGPLTVTFFAIDNFGLTPRNDVTVGTSDDIQPEFFAPFVNTPQTLCVLNDDSVFSLNGDPDGMGVDPTTQIWVVGDFESPVATIINLNRAEYSGVGTSDCALNEAGTQPNSVNLDTGVQNIGMPGVGVNPVTHEALLTAESSNEIALVKLPKTKIKQMTASKVSSISSKLPNDPVGDLFQAAEFPYGTAIDTCHNLGYVIDDFRTFVAQIDLAKLRENPAAVSTAPPSGTCASAATTFQCDNGEGVRFFPLPTPGGLIASGTNSGLSALFFNESGALKSKKAARRRR
jgi:hypothetical protein